MITNPKITNVARWGTVDAAFADGKPVTVWLLTNDGRHVVVPLAWYPRLMHATFEERESWGLLYDGEAIMWPAVGVAMFLDELLAGKGSKESKESFEAWLKGRQ